MTIQTIDANLRDAYKQCVPGTMQHVDQLMAKRRINPELDQLFSYLTADGNVYSLDQNRFFGKTPTLRITREATNPILINIDEAYHQLVSDQLWSCHSNGNYHVLPVDFETVKSAADTVTIDLTKLKLKNDGNSERSYLPIDTSKKITQYNDEQQTLLLRYFGPTKEDYTSNMQMLRDSPKPIKQTRIHVLNPDYVREYARENPLGRTSWLIQSSFTGDFDLYAHYRILHLADIDHIRAERKQ